MTTDLPILQGTEKQVAAAEKIRARVLSKIDATNRDWIDYLASKAKVDEKEIERARRWLASHEQARFWFDIETSDFWLHVRQAARKPMYATLMDEMLSDEGPKITHSCGCQKRYPMSGDLNERISMTNQLTARPCVDCDGKTKGDA